MKVSYKLTYIHIKVWYTLLRGNQMLLLRLLFVSTSPFYPTPKNDSLDPMKGIKLFQEMLISLGFPQNAKGTSSYREWTNGASQGHHEVGVVCGVCFLLLCIFETQQKLPSGFLSE